MTFELTDSLLNDIIFAMENQNCTSVFDAGENRIVTVNNDCGIYDDPLLNEDKEILEEVDEETIYSLPEWTSADGFEVMENFAEQCRAPLVQKELKTCLQSRRGVFRNFKNILKMYPEVEQKWFAYKDKAMHSKVNEWYNNLRESWGLERLEGDFIEETEELVQSDFEFIEYDSLRDKEAVDCAVEILAEEYKSNFKGSLGLSLADLWKFQSSYSKSENKHGFVCYSHSKEFLGCILVSSCPSSSKEAVTVTDFFVNQNYRGLGIGRELLEKCWTSLNQNGIHWIIFSNTIIPESMESLLTQFPVEKIGSGYIANLQKD